MNSIAEHSTTELVVPARSRGSDCDAGHAVTESVGGSAAASKIEAVSRSAHFIDNQNQSGAGLFVGLSLVAHAALLLVFASAPHNAHAASALATMEMEVEMLVEELAAPEPEPEIMPLGKLDAPVESTALTPPAPSPAPTVSPQPSNDAPAAQPSEQPPAAPEILTANNPYAVSADNVFTSGSGTQLARVVRAGAPSTAAPSTAMPSTGSGFGVENGQANASEEAKKRLAAWHSQVRAQLGAAAIRNYPLRAQKLGQQGALKVLVRISPSGQILSAQIASSSSYSLLDQTAVSGVQSVGQVAAPPTGTGATTLTLPVRFVLN